VHGEKEHKEVLSNGEADSLKLLSHVDTMVDLGLHGFYVLEGHKEELL